MAITNFPDPSGSPFTAPNGVIYTWIPSGSSGYWEAAPSALDFLKLDASNGPVTNDLEVQGKLDATGIEFSNSGYVLNKYETGLWTPTYSWSSNNPAITYTTRSGQYLRIGNLVMITGIIAVNTVNNAGAGQVTITGLPFNADNSEGQRAAISIGSITAFNSPGPQLGMVTPDHIELRQYLSGNSANIQASSIANGCTIRFSATYITADA